MKRKVELALSLDRIFQEDCRSVLDRIPEESVDLVVTSPPYNLGKEYESRRALEVYLDEQKAVIEKCVRALKKTGSVFWQVGAYSDKAKGALVPLDIRFFPIFESYGLIPKNRIIWARQHGLHATRKFSCRHETILWFTKSEDHVFNLDAIRVPQKWQNKKGYTDKDRGELTCNPLGKNPGDIWLFRNVKHNHEEQTIHPCQFPEDLISRIVLATTNAGNLVFDPYMGAGTVAVVARDLGRHYLGAETDPAYYEVSQRRLECRPNEKKSFANLKTLRQYIQRTNERIDGYKFDAQVGIVPTHSENSKIFSEQEHLAELERRLGYEEDCFAADLRKEARPEAVESIHSHLLNPTGKKRGRKPKKEPKSDFKQSSLFTDN